jgi:hypothetical protein
MRNMMSSERLTTRLPVVTGERVLRQRRRRCTGQETGLAASVCVFAATDESIIIKKPRDFAMKKRGQLGERCRWNDE